MSACYQTFAEVSRSDVNHFAIPSWPIQSNVIFQMFRVNSCKFHTIFHETWIQPAFLITFTSETTKLWILSRSFFLAKQKWNKPAMWPWLRKSGIPNPTIHSIRLHSEVYLAHKFLAHKSHTNLETYPNLLHPVEIWHEMSAFQRKKSCFNKHQHPKQGVFWPMMHFSVAAADAFATAVILTQRSRGAATMRTVDL